MPDHPIQPDDSIRSDDADAHTAADARDRRRMFVIIALMLVAFVAAVAYRREIRMRWWEHKLAATQDVSQRAYYLALLASEPDRAAPVAKRLLANADPATRSFGVSLAQRVPGVDGEKLLVEATSDPDPNVRRGAIMALSLRPDANVDAVSILRGLADDADIGVAMTAARCLVNVGNPKALAALTTLAKTHKRPGIRAQAIESLGEWSTADESVRDEVRDALTACLDDDTVFNQPTETERAALESLTHVAPQLAAQADTADEPAHTNADRARQILERIKK